MSVEFIQAIRMIAKEKNIPETRIIEAIESALVTAYRKDYGNKNQDIEVELRGESIESATVYVIKEVVEEVEDEDIEISLEDAKKIDPEVEIADEVRIDVTPVGYGRIATQAAKQVILQRIQEAEKDSLYHMFKDKEDSLMYAVVNRIEGSNVYLSLDKNTVLLPFKHQISNESYYTGRRLTVYLDRVRQTTRGPQLTISRTHPKLLERLLDREIPEVQTGEVRIERVSRDPGQRSKVAVSTDSENIDPVGACVGQKGMRINVITEELGGERIDMIEFTDKDEIFIARALQPARIAHVVIVNRHEFFDEKTGKKIKKRAAVFVDEAERAMAVGKRGQNIRLASDLTGYELDMYNIEELEIFMEKLMSLKEKRGDTEPVEAYSHTIEGEDRSDDADDIADEDFDDNEE